MPEGIPLAEEDASRPCLEYRLGPEPCWPWNTWWLPEPRQGFDGRSQEVKLQRHVNHLNNCWDSRIGHRLKQCPDYQQGLRVCQSLIERFLQVGPERRRSKNSHHPFGRPLQRLVFGIEGFECRTTMVAPALYTVGQRPCNLLLTVSSFGHVFWGDIRRQRRFAFGYICHYSSNCS